MFGDSYIEHEYYGICFNFDEWKKYALALMENQRGNFGYITNFILIEQIKPYVKGYALKPIMKIGTKTITLEMRKFDTEVSLLSFVKNNKIYLNNIFFTESGIKMRYGMDDNDKNEI